LHSGEIEAAAVAQAHRFSAWKCGRRFGKTSTLVTLAIDAALCGQAVGYFAPAYKLSAPTFKALKFALAPVIASVNASSGLIEIEGGGSVEIWTLEHPYAGRSRKYHLVEIDEAAFGRDDLVEVYQSAIAPTLLDLPGAGDRRLDAARNRARQFFHQVCTKEEFGFVAGSITRRRTRIRFSRATNWSGSGRSITRSSISRNSRLSSSISAALGCS
jgi:hypothetical protein